MTKIKRTPRSFVGDVDTYWWDEPAGSIDVHVSEKPRYSNVLGPDGCPYEYEDQPVGFRRQP